MKTLLRIYLVLIFASSSLGTGLENDSISSRFPLEASNFATNPSVPLYQSEIAECLNASSNGEFKLMKEASSKTLE